MRTQIIASILIAALAGGAFGTTQHRFGAAAVTVQADSPLGMNLAPLTDYGDEDPFLDRMKLARGWFGQTAAEFDTDETAAIQLDPHGWVTTLTPRVGSAARFTRVATFLMDSGGAAEHNDYAGDYAVRYRGQGTLDYGNAQLLSRSTGRDVIRISSGGQVQLRITATDPQRNGNYLRDIQVVRLDQEARLERGEIFDPAWLARLQPFRTLRFMDWLRTNGAEARVAFADRPLPSDAFYTSAAGAPLETVVALSNLLQAEPWLTMPTFADDSDLAAAAALIRDQLDPRLNLYVEYSNEVWNTGAAFHPYGGYVDQQAELVFPAEAAADFYTARINQHGRRTAELCTIWKQVFGAQAQRVICVLGAQAANPWTAEEALQCPLWRDHADNPRRGVSCQAQGIDAVAIAPYFGSYLGDPAWQSQVRTFTLNRLFTELTTGGQISDPQPGDWNDPPPGGALAEAISWINDYAAQADQLGYRLLAYEGGQHLAPIGAAAHDDQLVGLLTAANRDPRMGQLYRSYLAAWVDAGQLLVHYNYAARPGPYGNWGALEYRDQPSSVKYDALKAFAAATACNWPDCTLWRETWLLYLPDIRR